jgi:hypothetical protein
VFDPSFDSWPIRLDWTSGWDMRARVPRQHRLRPSNRPRARHHLSSSSSITTRSAPPSRPGDAEVMGWFSGQIPGGPSVEHIQVFDEQLSIMVGQNSRVSWGSQITGLSRSPAGVGGNPTRGSGAPPSTFQRPLLGDTPRRMVPNSSSLHPTPEKRKKRKSKKSPEEPKREEREEIR